ncbi:4998_t:CDS:2, partial [Cetraspora pellucida]
IIICGNNNNNLSILQRYFLRPSSPEFDNLTYCKYNELYLFKYAEEPIDQHSLSSNTYLEKKQGGYRQCIVKPYKQEGMPAQATWQNYRELLSKDYINKTSNIQQGENETLMWISNFLNEHGKMVYQLNPEQKNIYQEIMYHISKNKPLTIFINGRAGRAALNYDGGRIAHSLFQIPIEYNDDGCKCQIDPNGERAELIRESSAITWDELPMAQKGNIEAVDIQIRTLCKCDLPFGGKIFIGIGDFHQVAPVITRGGRIATILESIKSSPIWNTFKIYNLQTPVRDAQDPEYSQLMDDIGDDDLADDEKQKNHMVQKNTITTELLNSFNAPGIPQHCLTLKRGCIATIMPYSSTFNSSQGLTLDRVVLDLHTPVFSHGQLYTALTRVRQRDYVLILTEHNHSIDTFTTKNI